MMDMLELDERLDAMVDALGRHVVVDELWNYLNSDDKEEALECIVREYSLYFDNDSRTYEPEF